MLRETLQPAGPHGPLYAVSLTPPEVRGAPLVMIHDSLGCVSLWGGLPERLATATGRRVVVYDRAGFGRSVPREDRLAPDFVAEEAETDLAAVLEAAALERFALLGHSVGGSMAVEAAAARSDRCTGVVTLASPTFVEPLTLDGIRRMRPGFDEPARRAQLEAHHGERTGWVLDAWSGTWLSPGFAGFALDGALARLACPVLAIHGTDDLYGSEAHPRRIEAHAAAGAEVAMLAGEGHFPHRTSEAAVVRLATAFLACRD